MPEHSGNAPILDPNERLTLPEQVRLLVRIMPEDQARARIGKAFRFREVDYRPLHAVSYEDAQIDWKTGRVILRRLPRPFTPTLTTAEFIRHFMPSGLGATETPGVAPLSSEEPGANARDPQGFATERAAVPHASGTRNTTAEKAEVACGEWIAGLTERPRNKETAFTDAKAAVANIGVLSGKAFERAWAVRALPEWKKPGRRKERPIA